MRDVVVGGACGLLVGALAGLPWLSARSDEASSTVGLPVLDPGPVDGSWTAVPVPHTDLDRAVRILARHAGEGWIRCPVGDSWSPEGTVREWVHAHVEHGELVATVPEPEGAIALRASSDPADAPPRVVVQWAEALPGEAGRCRSLVPERVEVTGLVVGRSRRPMGGGHVHGELGPWPIDDDGYFTATCYRGAPCELTAQPGRLGRLGRLDEVRVPLGRTVTVVIEPDNPVIELDYVPVRRRSWIRSVEHEVDARGQAIRMVDPIDLALVDPLMPPPIAERFLRWQERDEAERMSAVGLLDAIAAH